MSFSNKKGWKETTLGQMLTFQRGFDITKKEQHPGPYQVISSSGPKSTHNDFKVKGPGVVIGRKGTLGSVFYSEGSFWPHDTTLWIKDFHGNDEKFAYYFLQTMSLEQYDCGASNPTINRNHIHIFTVRFPQLSIQRKIASILSSYDDLIENNTRRIEILEQMAKLVYEEWFIKFRFPGHENVKMIPSELGEIPEGWKVDKLGDICDIVMGQSPKSEFYNENGEGLPFHQGVTNFGDRFPTDKIYCTVLNRIAEKEDVLFSVRAPVGRINIANKKIVVGRGLCAIRSKTGSQSFVFQQLKNKFQIEDSMGGGTIFKSVTKNDMYDIKMIVPLPSLISKFEEIIQPVFRILEIITMKNQNLRKTRDLLLPKLISGEIDVSDLDIRIRNELQEP